MKPSAYPARVTVLVILMLGGMFAAAVAGITWWLRGDLREQILRREGESLHAVALMQQSLERDRLGEAAAAASPDQLGLLALQTSRLKGVLGAKVFDRAGAALDSLPITLVLPPPSPAEWAALQALQPVVRFNPAGSLGTLYGLGAGPGETAPLLDITVPLHGTESSQLEGAAQYVVDGAPLGREFRRLDRQLLRQAALVWLLVTGVGAAVVGWMFQRIARANTALQARTADLVQANRELALAAKTSALGAVTAHLMHGLRNPLAGLEAFLKEPPAAMAGGSATDWSEATAATRRLKEMVDEVVTLMRDEQAGAVFELSCQETLELVRARVAPFAAARAITVTVAAGTEAKLTNHQAGLVAAILTNLAQNACEALPRGTGSVGVHARSLPSGELAFAVEDNGPGLPATVQANPFEPRPSTKPAGAGIGLAISRQLAAHLGARLILTSTGSSGTVFSLLIPAVKPLSP